MGLRRIFLCICFILEDTLYLEFNQNNKNLIPPLPPRQLVVDVHKYIYENVNEVKFHKY